MIKIVVNGTPYTDFLSASVTVSLETMANDFSITTSAVGNFPPLRQGDEVEILVDDTKVLTGYVAEVSGQEREGAHSVTYSGRDKTSDLIDSQINIINDLRASDSLTLKRIIETVISHLGSMLKVVDELSPAAFNEAEDIVAPKVGQGALELIMAYARKRQALLSSTGDGDVLITQSSPTDSGAVVQRIEGAGDNNILTQNWSIQASKRFNTYIRRGQLDPAALNYAGDTSSEAIEDQSGTATDSTVRSGRQNVKVESNVSSPYGQLSYSSEQLANLALWSKQLAKAQSTRFNCTVKGHQMPDGGLWLVNTLVQVNSDTADISRKMLLNSITFSDGDNQPEISSLEFVERDVYTINERILAQQPKGSLYDAYSSLG